MLAYTNRRFSVGRDDLLSNPASNAEAESRPCSSIKSGPCRFNIIDPESVVITSLSRTYGI